MDRPIGIRILPRRLHRLIGQGRIKRKGGKTILGTIGIDETGQTSRIENSLGRIKPLIE